MIEYRMLKVLGNLNLSTHYHSACKNLSLRKVTKEAYQNKDGSKIFRVIARKRNKLFKNSQDIKSNVITYFNITVVLNL